MHILGDISEYYPCNVIKKNKRYFDCVAKNVL